MTHTIRVTDVGLEFIYADDLRFLNQLGRTETKRASHVEPDPDRPSYWLADMSPVSPGVVLIGFETRAAALEAEVAWLKQNKGL